MYIPTVHSPPRGGPAAQRQTGPAVHPAVPGPLSAFASVLYRLVLSAFGFLFDTASSVRDGLARRQFSDDPSKNQDIKIGLIVALTVSAFLAAVIAFLYVYGRSIRCFERKRRRHRRHKFSSSKSSTRSDDGPPPKPMPRGPPGDLPPKDPPKD